MPVTLTCYAMPLPPTPPSLSIPNFGVIQQAMGALDQIQTPGDLLAKFQDQLSMAMAPIRRFIDIVDAFMAMNNCIRAIPQAIMSLSPQPIFDCLKKLAQVVARIASYVPPMAYIATVVGILKYSVSVITEIYTLFQRLDSIITEYMAALATAQSAGDTVLEAHVRCGMEETRAVALNLFELLKFIQPLNDILLNVMVEYLAPGPLKMAMGQYQQAAGYISGAQTAMLAHEALPTYAGAVEKAWNQEVPVPPLGPLMYALYAIQVALATIHNVLAPMVGQDPNLPTVEPPEMTWL